MSAGAERREQSISEAVAGLAAAGWVEVGEAAAATGRSLAEVARLAEAGDLNVLSLTGWTEDGVPRAVHVVRVADLRAAPSRPSLKAV